MACAACAPRARGGVSGELTGGLCGSGAGAGSPACRALRRRSARREWKAMGAPSSGAHSVVARKLNEGGSANRRAATPWRDIDGASRGGVGWWCVAREGWWVPKTDRQTNRQRERERRAGGRWRTSRRAGKHQHQSRLVGAGQARVEPEPLLELGRPRLDQPRRLAPHRQQPRVHLPPATCRVRWSSEAVVAARGVAAGPASREALHCSGQVVRDERVEDAEERRWPQHEHVDVKQQHVSTEYAV